MSTFSIDGLVSNLNTTEIIDALVSSYKATANRVATSRTNTSNRLAAIQGLSANVLSVGAASTGLANANTFRARTASSSNSDLVQATATSAAEVGSFAVKVDQLATAQQISSDPDNAFDSNTEALNLSGNLRINDTTISLRATDTLRDVASRISNAGAGVAASIIEVEDGQFRLSIRSTKTGSAGFTLSNAGTSDVLEGLRLVDSSSDGIANTIEDGAASRLLSSKTGNVGVLMNLGENAPSGTVQIGNGAGSISVSVNLATENLNTIASNINTAAVSAGNAIRASVVEADTGKFRLEITSGDDTAPVFTDSNNVLETLGVVESQFSQLDQEGLDSKFKVNGISISRSTNTITDIMEGVTFTLQSDDNPDAETIISVSTSNTSAVNAVKSFVDSYNTIKAYSTEYASYNSETQEAGILLGDGSLLSVNSNLSSLLFRSISTLPSSNLTDLNSGDGVADGKIEITNRAGVTATLDLSSADTLQDVMDAINRTSSLSIQATVNRSGTGLNLVDSSKGTGSLTIEEVDGGTTATDLGILGQSTGATLYGRAIGESEMLTLSQLGVIVNADGTLTFNQAEFTEYFKDNAGAVEAFFTQKNGFAEQVSSTVRQLTDTRTGSLSVEAESLKKTIDNYSETITKIQERATAAEERYRRQFTQLESSLAQMQSEGDYLTAQLQAITNANSKKK